MAKKGFDGWVGAGDEELHAGSGGLALGVLIFRGDSRADIPACCPPDLRIRQKMLRSCCMYTVNTRYPEPEPRITLPTISGQYRCQGGKSHVFAHHFAHHFCLDRGG